LLRFLKINTAKLERTNEVEEDELIHKEDKMKGTLKL